MAPYFVQLREFERSLLRGAITEAAGDMKLAAQMLGVTRHYVYARAQFLGGVVKDDPKNEPPGLAAKAWANTNNIDRKGRREFHVEVAGQKSEANGA